MSQVKCTLCGAVVAANAAVCSTCGTSLQQGLGQAQAPAGFGQAQAPAGFGQAQAPTGFGQAQAPTGFSQTQAPTGFGQPSGFGTATIGFKQQAAEDTGFGQQQAAQSFGQTPATEPPSGFNEPDSAPVFGQAPMVPVESGVLYWSFGKCMLYFAKQIIPIYGLIVFISSIIGNPRKFPPMVTNLMRALLVFNLAVTVLVTVSFFAGFGAILQQLVR